MKKNIMLAIALMVSVLVFGQNKYKNPDSLARHQTEKMKSLLDLSEGQYASIREINQKYATQVMALRKGTAIGRDQFHKEIQAIDNEKEKDLQKVLTPEQRGKWKTYRNEVKERRNLHKGHVRENRQHYQKNILSLTDEQAEKMKLAKDEFRGKLQYLQGDSTLSEENRKQKFQAAKADHESVVKTILNEEQFKQWKENFVRKEKRMRKRQQGHQMRK
jgi:hypothetical protein